MYEDLESESPTYFIIWLTKDKEDPDAENRVGRDLLPGVLRKREKVTGRGLYAFVKILEDSANIALRQNNLL